MQVAKLRALWLELPLIERLRLYDQGTLKGLEGLSISDLFPEKRLIELWLAENHS
jgi:hypothetical protein